MSTVIVFATPIEASPEIWVEATRDKVIACLERLTDPEQRARANRPAFAVAALFRLMSADEQGEWDPAVYSIPVSDRDGAIEWLTAGLNPSVLWNCTAWCETKWAGDPDGSDPVGFAS